MIKYLWQLPQNIIGLIFMLVFRGKYEQDYNDKKVYLVNREFVYSLGKYIIMSKKWYWDTATRIPSYNERLLAHEYGHCRQSEMLGWLYLIIVGVPSFIMNRISKYNRKFARNYYNRFPENWADKLGGVGRKSL